MNRKKKLSQKKPLYLNPVDENYRSLKKSALISITLYVIAVLSAILPKNKYINPGVNEKTNFVVAHAGGAMENGGKTKKYLNSVEGFVANYKDGTRMFEYDFVFSKEGKLVGTHKFEYLSGYSLENRIPYDQYMKTKIDGKFTGITEEKLFDLIRSYPDAQFIIDTKEKDPFLVYSRIIDLAKEKNIDISSSIIPFVFSEKMLDLLNEKYDFKEMMYSNYKNHKTTKELLNIIKDCSKIKYLHIFPYDFLFKDIDQFNKLGIRVFAHMDKSDVGRTALAYGCTGIFSDDISEKEFKQKHYSFLKSKLGCENNFSYSPVDRNLPVINQKKISRGFQFQ